MELVMKNNSSFWKALLTSLMVFDCFLGYTPPHRNQVSSQLKRLYNYHFQILKNELKEVDYIGLTIDFWTSRLCMAYMCITGHCYND